MSKSSTIHFIYQNYPEEQSECINVDEAFFKQKAFLDTFQYLDNLKATAPATLVEKILKEAHD